MLCMNLKAMPAQESVRAKLSFLFCCFYFFPRSGIQTLSKRQYNYPEVCFARVSICISTEDGCCWDSSSVLRSFQSPQPDAQNRAICEQTANSACSQQRIPAGGCSFILTSAAAIYSARCVVMLCILFFPSFFLLTLQSFKNKSSLQL